MSKHNHSLMIEEEKKSRKVKCNMVITRDRIVQVTSKIRLGDEIKTLSYLLFYIFHLVVGHNK